MAIKRYTIEQMKKLKSQSDWEAVKNMKDEDIDTSDPDAPDAAELLEKGLAHRVGRPKQLNPKEMITIRVDADALAQLRASGSGWQTRLSKQISQWAIKELH
ncbi:MAG: BrnA antitoxin family protein [Elusimicrobiota bacterium]|jgi:uncharacterized protein (DUF4415 family)|nr:BrnA antitoxin family protein [Elusimicrobiota bacterium]